MNKLKQGFTLIELIIVIAIIGMLALAVLAVINPLEQTNRTKDLSSKTNVAELGRAVQRYYTTQLAWPWTGIAAGTDVASTAITNVTGTGELKAGFTATGVILWTNGVADTSPIWGCFVPLSKAVKAEATNVKYTYAVGTGPVTGCTTGASGTCTHWCTQFN